ncbi:MAG: hypothetical protein CHACPFDD_00671 [Phycisphaerae bacterium]|nr:hypothetical protein [Phycisphaerae bacterium]
MTADASARGANQPAAPARGGIARGGPAWAGLILVATFAAYLPALRAGYIWDDDDYLTENQLVQRADGLGDIWLTRKTVQYYPMVFTSLWIEHRLWGLAPAGYHATNIALHAINALLVWRLATMLRIAWPWLIAAVFALHPVHVESVAWVTERKNVLSGMFYLAAILAYLRFDQRRRWGWYALSLLLFVAALLSKSVTATLPVVLLLMTYWRTGRFARRDLLLVGVFFVLGIAFGLHTAHLERDKVGAVGAEWSAGPLERVLIASRALWFYAGKIVWPHPLIFIYPRWQIDAARATDYVPLAGCLLLLTGCAWLARRKIVAPALLALFIGVTLFPALGFLNVYPHRFSYVADHFNYLGSLGYIVLFALLARRALDGALPAPRRAAAQPWLAVAVLAALGVVTFRQAGNYRGATTLWERTLAANDQAWIGMVNLGNDYAAAGRHDEARDLFERATKYPPAHFEAYSGLGQLADLRGDPSAAAGWYEKARDAKPDWSGAWSNLGVVYQKLNRLGDAAECLERSVKLLPTAGVPWNNLSRVYAAQGRMDDALAAAERAVACAPGDAEFLTHLGNVLVQQRTVKRLSRAAEAYAAAVRGDAARADARQGLMLALYELGRYDDAFRAAREAATKFPGDARIANQFAWMMATCPRDELRDGAEAVRLVRAVVAPQTGMRPTPLSTLAAGLAETGQFHDAADVAAHAVGMANGEGDAQKAAEIGRYLEAYRGGRPWRHVAVSD